MFTQMQKYHKAFLIFVTAIIAASFGMGSLFYSFFSPGNMEIVGSFAYNKVKVSKNEFYTAWERWQKFYDLVKELSPKAQKIQKVRLDENIQNYAYLFYWQNPIWDAIYSLREDVAKLDEKFDARLNDPNKWNLLVRGRLNPIEEELEFYQHITPKERDIVARKLPRNDVWNFLMLLYQAQEWGIYVGDNEVRDFIAETQQTFRPGPDEYAERLKNLGIFPSTLEKMVKDALVILKYLQSRTAGIKIPTKTVYEQYTQFNTQYRLQWVTLSNKGFMAQNDAEYLKERQSFYDQMIRVNPNYFKIPATASFDYLAIEGKAFAGQVQVSTDEIDKAYRSQTPQDEMEEFDPKAEQKRAEAKKQIASKLQIEKANAKALTMLKEIQDKVAGLGQAAALDVIAPIYHLEYKVFQMIPEEQFFADTDVKPTQATEIIYKTLVPGEFSTILDAAQADGYKKFYLFRLQQRESSKIPSKEEVEQNEALFLDRYYANNKDALRTPEQYRLAYVIADYKKIAQNLVITSKAKFDFYEKYKDQLYQVKDDKGEVSYKPFSEVEADLQHRLANFSAIQELQKLHEIYRICKEKGSDLQLGPVVKELANQVMLAPEGIRYVEDLELKTLDEIRQSNPANDAEIENLSLENPISAVKDISSGKYFYKVLAVVKPESKEFAKTQEQVKEHFLKTQALKKAETALKEWAELYRQQYKTARAALEQNYDLQIKAVWQKRDSVSGQEKQKYDEEGNRLSLEKQQRIQNLANSIFQTLALEKSLPVAQSALIERENLYEMKEFRESPQIYQVLSLEVNDLTSPIPVEKVGDVFLVQLLEKRVPSLSEIPTTQLDHIRDMLWQRSYHSRIAGFLTHSRLKETMGFKYEEYLEDEEEETSTPVQAPIPDDVDY